MLLRLHPVCPPSYPAGYLDEHQLGGQQECIGWPAGREALAVCQQSHTSRPSSRGVPAGPLAGFTGWLAG